MHIEYKPSNIQSSLTTTYMLSTLCFSDSCIHIWQGTYKISPYSKWWKQLTSLSQRPTHFNDLQGPWQVLGWCSLCCAPGSELFHGRSQKGNCIRKTSAWRNTTMSWCILSLYMNSQTLFSKLLISDLVALSLFLFSTITPPVRMVNESNKLWTNTWK